MSPSSGLLAVPQLLTPPIEDVWQQQDAVPNFLHKSDVLHELTGGLQTDGFVFCLTVLSI